MFLLRNRNIYICISPPKTCKEIAHPASFPSFSPPRSSFRTNNPLPASPQKSTKQIKLTDKPLSKPPNANSDDDDDDNDDDNNDDDDNNAFDDKNDRPIPLPNNFDSIYQYINLLYVYVYQKLKSYLPTRTYSIINQINNQSFARALEELILHNRWRNGGVAD